MSKKKATIAKKTPVKKALKKTVKKATTLRTPIKAGRVAAPAKTTAAATIFIYSVDGAARVRTSPQRLSAVSDAGWIEWTVVNLEGGDLVPVELTWRTDGPWGKAPISIRDGVARVSLNGARKGVYKYNVTAKGYTEDPEIEIDGM